jgi:pimeloyl-ACP methyl ester carboxylesterase
MPDPKLKGRLHHVRIPTLVLWVPDAKFVTIPGAGHFPHIEEPQTFTAHVAAFLRWRTAGIR